MPVLAYFWKVGAALLALLFLADLYLPRDQLLAPVAEKTAADHPTIYIRSDRKLPERVVLDTNSPVAVAAAPVPSVPSIAKTSATADPSPIRAETPATANALAMARTDSHPRDAVDRKPSRKTQHVAARSKRYPTPQMILAARQAQFAWFGFRY
jgi:hypothetical protein